MTVLPHLSQAQWLFYRGLHLPPSVPFYTVSEKSWWATASAMVHFVAATCETLLDPAIATRSPILPVVAFNSRRGKMNSSDGIVVNCIKAMGAAITSPYPYYGLLAVLEYFAFVSLLKKNPASAWDAVAFLVTTIFLVTIGVIVSRLIEKVGHEKMLSSEVVVKLAEIDAKLKVAETKVKKGAQS